MRSMSKHTVGVRDVKLVAQAVLLGFLAGVVVAYAVVYKSSRRMPDNLISEKVCMQAIIGK